MTRAITLLLFGWVGLAGAAINAYEFDTPEKEAMFQRLSQELRCLVCQNQNLADSSAELAQDLRQEIYRMVQAGEEEKAVIDFMVTRYGDFVLYRPPVNPTTYPLWVGPFVLFALGVATLTIMVRRRGSSDTRGELTTEERRRLDALLKPDGGERREP